MFGCIDMQGKKINQLMSSANFPKFSGSQLKILATKMTRKTYSTPTTQEH
jgi:hypothetical protein